MSLIFDSDSKLKAVTSSFGTFCCIGVRECAPLLKGSIYIPNPVPTMLGDSVDIVHQSDAFSRDKKVLSYNSLSIKYFI